MNQINLEHKQMMEATLVPSTLDDTKICSDIVQIHLWFFKVQVA